MNGPYFETPAPRFLRQADRNLSGLVVDIEFTMISILAGMMLVLLVGNAAPILRNLEFEYWPYVLYSLLAIMRFWDDAMGHVLAFIRWPMDLGHNLLYIGTAFLSGLSLYFLNDPMGFFACTSLLFLWRVAVATYDRRLIEYHKARASGMAVQFYARAYRRQQELRRLAIAVVPVPILAVAAIFLWPQFLIAGHGHLVFVILSCALLLYAIPIGIRSIDGLRQEILVKSAEELVGEESAPSSSPGLRPAG